MPNNSLSEDFLQEKMEVLSGWPPEEWDDAQDLSEALTEPQRTAVWALYDRVEDLLWTVTRGQLQSTDEVDPEELEGGLPIAFLRTLATYDQEQSHLTTWIWREARQQVRREIRAITGQSNAARRIERALSQLYVITKQEEQREPTLDEQIEYVREKVYCTRRISREAVIDRIARVEEQALSDPSLDEERGEGGEDGTFHDVLAGSHLGRIDVEEVGRIIAEQTQRTELWEALCQEDPSSRSVSSARAREILLELRARDADLEQIAWEHQTSPFVVALINEGAGPYSTTVTDEDVERYGKAQGYAEDEEEGRQRALSDDEVFRLRRMYEEGDYTHAQLADGVGVSATTLGKAVRGDAPYDDLT